VQQRHRAADPLLDIRRARVLEPHRADVGRRRAGVLMLILRTDRAGCEEQHRQGQKDTGAGPRGHQVTSEV
jgi:hypothetical protein